MKLKNLIYLVLFGLISFQTYASTSIIPTPQNIDNVSGEININDIKYITVEGSRMPVLYGFLDRLPRKPSNGIGVRLIIEGNDTAIGNEGYILSITPKSIEIKANTDTGLFYGCVTLSQIIQEAFDKNITLQAVEIIDFPALPVRAIHFDTKHHLDRTEYYYSLIDQLAYWKINTIIWELEDKLRYERRPECSSPNALSKQEMRAIADYAKERHIEINPLVQGLGHAGFILKNHWELRENPQSDWEFCPSNPETYQLQYDLYRDALEAFPYGKFLHVGGDEITEIGIDERCKATGKTPFELQMEWLDKVCNFAKDQGRTPIFWDDMPFKYGNLWWVIHRGLTNDEVDLNWSTQKLDEAIDLFPKDCVYMRWYYDDPTIYPHLKALEWYKNKGLRVMAATAAADGGSPYMPRRGSKIKDIQSFCELAVENNLKEGILATCWDDGSPHWETVKRGFAALGEFSWNPTGRKIKDFKKGFEQNYFGLYNSETEFIEDLEEAAYFFDKALISEGRRNPAWQVKNHKLIDLPDKKNPGKWSQKYRTRLDSAMQQIEKCKDLERQIKNASDNSRQNRYTFEIYDANNKLFQFPAELLKALEKYDKTEDVSEKKQAETEVLELCENFNSIKKDLIKTYGKTRFMEQPNGYISDMNHHMHLASLTLDSEWMFLYENDFINEIYKQLKK